MRKFFDTIIPKSEIGAVFLVIVFTGLLLAVLFKAPVILIRDDEWYFWQRYFFMYGLAIFLLYPMFIGILTVFTVGYYNPMTVGKSIGLSLLALIGVGLSVLIYALEGAICLIMAAPFVAVFALCGGLLGYAFHTKFPRREFNVFSASILFLLLIPSVSYFESGKTAEPDLIPVTTSVVINAPPEKVWKNVVEFPELAPPTEFIFKAGIAYPIRARIVGSGVGAIRYCEFSTGAFVEPVTIWDENKLLQFSVDEQPIPMRELSPYGELDTPHLHDFFVSRKGQFKLTRLENGNTLLEGTTWYYHKIKPEFYWRLWSEEIVHTIHQRVLGHIKARSEE